MKGLLVLLPVHGKEMSVRVDVPPYRQMVYSANGGSRLAGAAAASSKRISKDAAGRAQQAATMMGPLGIVKSKASDPSSSERERLSPPICQTLTDDLPFSFLLFSRRVGQRHRPLRLAPHHDLMGDRGRDTAILTLRVLQGK